MNDHVKRIQSPLWRKTLAVSVGLHCLPPALPWPFSEVWSRLIPTISRFYSLLRLEYFGGLFRHRVYFLISTSGAFFFLGFFFFFFFSFCWFFSEGHNLLSQSGLVKFHGSYLKHPDTPFWLSFISACHCLWHLLSSSFHVIYCKTFCLTSH